MMGTKTEGKDIIELKSHGCGTHVHDLNEDVDKSRKDLNVGGWKIDGVL